MLLLMPPILPVEVWHTIFEAALPPARSVLDIPDVIRHTQLVFKFRHVCREWGAIIRGRKSFFRVCFWKVSLPEDRGDAEARDVLDGLERWCLNADRLTLVLRLSTSTSDRAHDRLISLLRRVHSTIEAIHLLVPRPNDANRGVCMSEFFIPTGSEHHRCSTSRWGCPATWLKGFPFSRLCTTQVDRDTVKCNLARFSRHEERGP